MLYREGLIEVATFEQKFGKGKGTSLADISDVSTFHAKRSKNKGPDARL